MDSTQQELDILRQLGDGLVLRRSQPGDIEALADFNSRLHSEDGPDKPDERIGAWVRDLLTQPHPSFEPGDFTLVQEQKTGKIVSSLNLISQTWTYAGIPFGVGRPEVVGTLPEYRKRGLVRSQFEAVHTLSQSRGHLAQAITGIPNYYRQFGYEMALDLGGGRVGFEPQLPKLKEGASEPFIIRPALEGDLPFLVELDQRGAQRSALYCLRNEKEWRYELLGMSPKNVNRLEIRIIENQSAEAVGALAHPWFNWDFGGAVLFYYELKPGVSWLSVTPSVARYLWKFGGEFAEQAGKSRTGYAFWLGTSHPAYDVFRDHLPQVRDPYAFFMRVPDLTGFMRHILPSLEKRLAGSDLATGFTGDLRLNFYRSGLQLKFNAGQITDVSDFQPTSSMDGDAFFPDLTFLQLLFGYRSFDELEQSFADIMTRNDNAYVLLNVLFPRKPSLVLPLA